MIVSSLGSLFMKHRFFLFHTPIIALGKVFSTTVTIYIMLLVLLNTYWDWQILRVWGHFTRFWAKTIINLWSSLSKTSRATSNWLGWIRKTMHICGLSQYQQQVKLLAGLKWTWSELLGRVLKYLGDVFSGSWVANEGNWPFDSTHSPMWVTEH